MTSIDGLRDEHRRIEAMLSALDAVAERLDRDEAAPAFVEELIEFFRLFADARHHAKEEQRLFPLLAGGDSSYGVIDALRHHHDLGRMLVGEMRQALTHLRAGDPAAARTFAASARSYTPAARAHRHRRARGLRRGRPDADGHRRAYAARGLRGARHHARRPAAGRAMGTARRTGAGDERQPVTAMTVLEPWIGKPLDEVLGTLRDTLEDPDYPTVKRWREAGGKVLGHFQVYFPEEIAHAAGLLPLKIRGAQIEARQAEARFGSYLCSIIKTSLELALSKRVELELFVTPPICDAARNLAAVWGRNFTYPCEILYLPQNANSSHAPGLSAARVRSPAPRGSSASPAAP